MKKLLVASLIVGLLGSVSVCLAATPKEKKAAKAKEHVQKEEQPAPGSYAYLGIGIGPLHPAVVSYLGDLLENGHGVLIDQVAEGSPAYKAGLKPNDIVVRYGDHDVSSPEQLVGMVRRDKPGDSVTLGIVRAGKKMELKVTLGEHQPAMAMRAHRALRPVTPEEREDAWKLFDSMTFKRLDENRFQAVINYRNEKGEIEQHKFEGTRDEIRKAIEGEQDMPLAERQQLLESLRLAGHPLEFRLPGFRYFPWGGVTWDFEPTEY
jgi:membrane-associated protease RseP (regulator of RpoE activity)